LQVGESRARGARRIDRRPAGAQHGTNRRVDRQQRSRVDYPAAVVALNATVNTNKRKIAADDFFKGCTRRAADDEIITSVSFPLPKKAAYVKFPQPASRFALVGVFVAQTSSGVRVAVTGRTDACSAPRRSKTRSPKSFTADAAKACSIDAAGLNNDIHGSAAYRAHLVPVLASRAVTAAG
jgi:carbon-monoxide dehydrogenase medium subunit